MPAVLYPLGQLPPPALDWPQLIPLLGPSSAAVARYDGTLAAVSNAAVHQKPVCGSVFVETEPQAALWLACEPQRVMQSEVVEVPRRMGQ